MNDEFLDGNIENTYEELTKVVNAKNDIKSSLTVSAGEFNLNETKLEELQDVLHNIRIKIISNPILQELNNITEEDATLQQKLAEGIYLNLPDLSSRLNLYQENFSKFDEVYNQVQKMHLVTERKLENKMNTITSLKINLTNKYGALLKNFEIEESRKCQELKDNIENLLENIAEENHTSKCLSYVIDSKKNMLQKLIEVNESILIDPDYFQLKNNENNLLSEKETELNKETIELFERANNLFIKMNELKQQKQSHQVARTELLKILDSRKSLLERKNLCSSIQDLKMLVLRKTAQLHNLNENILKQENHSSQTESKLNLCEIEVNDITDQINIQKNIHVEQVNENEDISKNRDLEDNIKEINKKLSILLETKNKAQYSINISLEKETFLLSEISKLNEYLGATQEVTKKLNEKIFKVQNELDEKAKILTETPSYEEVEKENNILNLKIRRYIKAIEISKKHRATKVEKKRGFEDYSDSSQDSMFLPKKKK